VQVKSQAKSGKEFSKMSHLSIVLLMVYYGEMFKKDHITRLKRGEVGVIPTDTLYGLVTLAHSKESFDRLFDIKGMKQNRKGVVVLLASALDISLFGITLTDFEKGILERL